MVQYMFVHSVVLWKCVEPEALLKERCWFPYLEKCKLWLQDLEHVLYAVVMLPRFYQIISSEKEKKNLYEFSKSNTVLLYRIF